jgi:hypothetical protein
MARVIEFYVPKNFRNRFARPVQPHPGKLVEFCLPAAKSVPTRSAGGVLAWLLEATEPNRAVGGEWSSDPGAA